MEPLSGIEPETYALRKRRSTSWAITAREPPLYWISIPRENEWKTYLQSHLLYLTPVNATIVRAYRRESIKVIRIFIEESIRARSEAGLSRLPVTEKIAGSNPVGPAKKLSLKTLSGVFLLGRSITSPVPTWTIDTMVFIL